MRKSPCNESNEKTPVVVIPKEKAVFWLDKEGFWRNEAGRFRKKKIIDHFHASIKKDEQGYFLTQDKGGIKEKVYFPYEDTALFVFDMKPEDNGFLLVLNTGEKILLDPETLYTKNDMLYFVTESGEIVKFAERALMKIAPFIEEKDGDLHLKAGNRLYRIVSRQ